jgi:hypothetical protein
LSEPQKSPKAVLVIMNSGGSEEGHVHSNRKLAGKWSWPLLVLGSRLLENGLPTFAQYESRSLVEHAYLRKVLITVEKG